MFWFNKACNNVYKKVYDKAYNDMYNNIYNNIYNKKYKIKCMKSYKVSSMSKTTLKSNKDSAYKPELLIGAGDMERLKTAIHFGADAVYFGGKAFGLRAFASNFDDITIPVEYCHRHGKKAYVTVNIYARNFDFEELKKYLKYLHSSKVDGIIVSDIGIMSIAKQIVPDLELHVSTQANTTNFISALEYANNYNAKRVVLARELTFPEIKQITNVLSEKDVETEIFVHGAMCISYSGRCLLSNFLTGRDSNRGACVQACRWAYSLVENDKTIKQQKDKAKEPMPIEEDEHGTYILNSKDLCLIEHLKSLIDAKIKSFKVEGRMKSPYYVATVTNAYRKAIDGILEGKEVDLKSLKTELLKCSHRDYTTGFAFSDGNNLQNYQTSHQTQSSEFLGIITAVDNSTKKIQIEMRNRFKVGDTVEFLAKQIDTIGYKSKIVSMQNEKGEEVLDAKLVQERLWVAFEDEKLAEQLLPLDIIRSC